MMRRTNITNAVRAAIWPLTAALALTAQGQGLNNLWMGGYGSDFGPPLGGVDINFASGGPVVSYVEREMEFARTSANITSPDGDLLFCTNGYYLANAEGDTMLNGSGLNPSAYTSLFADGLHLPQASLILPAPDQEAIYYLFHGTYDDQVGQTASFLYATVIDMALDGGLGGVVSKNIVLIADALNIGKITAVKHANGRDWWVVCHKANSSTYYRLIITPEGIGAIQEQQIGSIRPPDVGQVCFSPDGSKFAYYWGLYDLDILDFDRCTGQFSDPVHIDIDDEDQLGGVAFSPNSQFLYVASTNDVYQFDVTAPDIGSTQVHIAQWDSFYSPEPPFATLFDVAQLAPDGKIYIGTANSTFHLHVINHPDVPGSGCNMVQHGLELPAYYQSSLPNHPNYHLGPLAGSPCDTLGLGVEEKPPDLNLGAYPNPSTGQFTLSYRAQSTEGTLEIRDVSGKSVLLERIPPWSTVHKVALPDVGAGLYQCTLRWGLCTAALRVVIER